MIDSSLPHSIRTRPKGMPDPSSVASVASVAERVTSALGAGPSGSPLRAVAAALAADLAGLLVGLRPACLLDYAPRCRAAHAVALLEGLKAAALDELPGLASLHCLRVGSGTTLLVNWATLRDATDALPAGPVLVDVTRPSPTVADVGTAQRVRQELAKVIEALVAEQEAEGGRRRKSDASFGTLDVLVRMDRGYEGGFGAADAGSDGGWGGGGGGGENGDAQSDEAWLRTPLPTVLGFLLGYPAVSTFVVADGAASTVGVGGPLRIYRVDWKGEAGAALQFSVPESLAGLIAESEAWGAWLSHVRRLDRWVDGPAHTIVDDGRKVVL